MRLQVRKRQGEWQSVADEMGLSDSVVDECMESR